MLFFSKLANESSRQAALLAGIVFVALLGLLPSIAKYHGDECFYTDAAIRMLQTGDYLTPYAASGALRFAKPILPYWAVLAGYFGLGVNFLASRLFFLAAGSLVIFFTYKLSLAVFRKSNEALLAALIIASNVQLLTISIRSTPDALLCLFVLLSLLGFARLLFQNDRSWKNYALAYVGAGLAVETRGLPGVAVAVFPFLYWLLFQRRTRRWRELVEWKAVALGLIVGLAWFGAMLWLHGRALLDGFYYDQVRGNVRDFTYLDTLRNFQAYFFGVLRHFVPWTVLLCAALVVAPRTVAAFWREHRAQCWFLAGWFLFILLPFVFGRFSRTRYMIVAYPLLAVLLAALLCHCATIASWRRGLSKAVGWAAVVFALTGLILTAAGFVVNPRIAAAGAVWLVTGCLIWVGARRQHFGLLYGAIGAFSLVAFWSTELLLRPFFAESPAPALTARLVPEAPATRKVYALNFSPSYQAQIRVLSGGRLRVAPLTIEPGTELPLGNDPLVLAEKEKPLVAHQAGTVEAVGFAGDKWHGKDFLDLLHADRRASTFARHRSPYYIFFPAAPGHPSRPVQPGGDH